MPASPLLIVSPKSWREACFALPATRALAALQPVLILCESHQEGFWTASGLGQVIPHDMTVKGILAGLPEVERVLLWEDGPAAKACAKAKVRERIGLPAPGLAKRLTNPLNLMVEAGPPEHRVRRFLETAAALGADAMRPENFQPMATPETRHDEAILIVPDSDFGRHFEWPLARWQEVLDQFDGKEVLLADGVIARQLGHQTIDLCDPTKAGTFGRCIAADGSIPHVAAAFGTKCAVLYGPGDPDLIRPLGKQHSIIRHKVECSPCFADRCLMDGRCQNDLTAEQVLHALVPFMAS